MPTVSIMIPTNRSRDVLETCLRAIGRQRFDLTEIEVVVGYNGDDSPPVWEPDAWPFAVVVARSSPGSVTAARNAGLDLARGECLIWVNDDLSPEPDFVAGHVAAHARLEQPALVLGKAVWRRYEDETVFDRMIRTTSMIFFYDQMRPHEWYNFRHAWTLNLSVMRRHCGALRFDERLPIFFEDLEWGYRAWKQYGARVWYAPEIRGLHDHRHTLRDYLERERRHGRAAVLLWRTNPACFRDIFADDLDAAYLDYCREFVRVEGRREQEMLARLEAVATRPAGELGENPESQDRVVQALYEAHAPLKRLAFRRGLLKAIDQQASERMETTREGVCPV